MSSRASSGPPFALVEVTRLPLPFARVAANDAPHDPHVAKALAAIEADLRRRWTVANLARVGGLSRAAFARRFQRALGVGPIAYVTEARLRRAAEALAATDDALATLADLVGYASEFAFSKAFKRRYGVAPGSYRRRLAHVPTTRCAA